MRPVFLFILMSSDFELLKAGVFGSCSFHSKFSSLHGTVNRSGPIKFSWFWHRWWRNNGRKDNNMWPLMVISCLTQPIQLCNSFCTHDNLVCLDFIFASFWSPPAHVPLARIYCVVRAARGLHHKNFIYAQYCLMCFPMLFIFKVCICCSLRTTHKNTAIFLMSVH